MYFISYYGTPLATFEVYMVAIDIESKHAAYIRKYEYFERSTNFIYIIKMIY